ncbi:toxic anion resistance protein [Sporolactobacillus laevolacticus]|uniref:toxic anion resistance protein n=1 Tax=Sporolactobacillus laevolacticus TaxID=33018 RepID=UPI0025B56357|nr:toxic anion resistance protein [Sporolactobacillus laevolacticus]MDN3954454.1 toxic anion resistance protein [Sporolactobacillus laevolacticus]
MAFSMDVPDTDQVKADVQEQIKPLPEKEARIKELAEKNVAQIMALGATDAESFGERKEILHSVDTFGLDVMKNSSGKNTLLKVSVGKLSKSGDEGGQVARGLTDLQTQLKDLDPSLIDFTKTGLLGKLFNPIRTYFRKYQKADSVIGDIIESLDKGKTVLKNDNTTLEIEQQGLRELTKKVQENIELGSAMDEAIANQIQAAQARNENPEKVAFVQEEILFPLRQRVMDLQQMLVVNQQGIMAYEVVIRNNKELIRGVDRAKTVTVSALRNAVVVASALYDQKIVLNKIDALNKTTNTFIAGTSKMLKEQGVAIQEQAMQTGVSVETLKTAFADVLSALDSIDEYKRQALPKMHDTIEQFRQLADEGEKQIQKFEKGSNVSIQP